MKTLIWKEMREIALWALGGALLLLAAMCMFISQAEGHSDYTYFNQNADQLYDSFCHWMLIGAPVTAMVLGFVQTLPELSRDQWAFLVHRPLTMKQIWAAKVIAGLSAYLAATLIPLILVTAWLCAPQHFPGPFEWKLAIPDLSYILAGMTFYFAGLWIEQKTVHGVWIKILAFCVAGLSIATLTEINIELLVLTIPLLFVIPLAIGSRISFDRFISSRLSTINKSVLAVCYAVGAVVNVLLVVAIISGFLSIFLPSHSGWKRGEEESIAVSDVGTLVLVDSMQDNSSPDRFVRVMDLTGHDIPGANLKRIFYTSCDPLYSNYQSNYSISSYSHWYGQEDVYQSCAFYDRDLRLFQLFTPSTYRFRGYIGREAALRSNPADAVKFPSDEPSLSLGLVAFKHDAFLLSSDQTFPYITHLLSTASDDIILCSNRLNRPDKNPPYLILSSKGFHLYSSTGDLIRSENVSMPSNGMGMYGICISPTSSRIVIGSQFVVGFDGASGDVPLANPIVKQRGDVTTVAWDQHPYEQKANIWQASPAVFAPLLPLATFIAAMDIYAAHTDGSYTKSTDWIQMMEYVCMWSALGGIIAMFAMIPMANRYGVTGARRIIWMVNGFLFSWLTPLIILALWLPPTRIVCPLCGKKRLVKSKLCEHCEREMPKPDDTGREIFEFNDSSHPDLALLGS